MAIVSANTLRMPTKQVHDEDEFTQAYVTMLGVMRRVYDLGGDPEIKNIIDKAERALARRCSDSRSQHRRQRAAL